MTQYVDHVADAWSEWWSGDDERASAIVYARTVEWWDVRRGRATEVKGRPALLDERAARRAHTERFAVEACRLVPDDDVVVVEFVAVARDCGAPVAAPGCAWWHLDVDGRIDREEWYLNWDDRRPADPAVAGHAVAGGGVERTPQWYRSFVHDVLAAWDASPPAMVDDFYADGAVVDTMGAGPNGVMRGARVLRAAEAMVAERLVERRSTVGKVAGAGPVVACTHLTVMRTADGPRRTTPVARVFTLGADDRIVGDHVYRLPAWPAGGRR